MCQSIQNVIHLTTAFERNRDHFPASSKNSFVKCISSSCFKIFRATSNFFPLVNLQIAL